MCMASTHDMQSKQTIIGDQLITYYERTHSDGPSILFLHGRGDQATTRKKITEYCNQHKYNRIAIDFPGFGNSTPPKESRSITQYATCVQQFLMKKEKQIHTMVGHSFGGRIICKLASLGDQPKHIVLVAAA